jgi:hypothetical protein
MPTPMRQRDRPSKTHECTSVSSATRMFSFAIIAGRSIVICRSPPQNARSIEMGKPFADKYDFQFILYFAGEDNVAQDNAKNLVVIAAEQGVLAKTEVIELEEMTSSATYDPSKCKPKAKGRVHVYIVGHGTDTSDRVGGCTASDLAKTVVTISEFTIKRVSIVSCHSGGDGAHVAPHRFVSDFWDQAKGFVDEVSGYTGSVHTERSRFATTRKLPANAFKSRSWSGEEWWVKKRSVKKVVSKEHAEGGKLRKVCFSKEGGFSRGWKAVDM